MKVLFYLVHPGHYHLFKNVIKKLNIMNIDTILVVRPKESLEQLLKEDGFDYIKINDGIRKNNKWAMFTDMILRDYRAFNIIKKIKPALMIGSSFEIAHIGKLLNIPSVITHEDDYDNMKFFSYSAFPFASNILSPISCRQGRWEKKCIHYPGYHELAYLHPNHFIADQKIKDLLDCDKYFLLRFSQFNAHHDFGFNGISDSIAHELINILEKHGKVFISSERELDRTLENYRVKIKPSQMHDLLNYAEMYIGDSQTMAMEAAILGIPAIRFNKFAKNYSISVLDELENKYGLTVSINNRSSEKLLKTVKEFVDNKELKNLWAERRNKMLNDKYDTCKFITWFIQEYPASINKSFNN